MNVSSFSLLSAHLASTGQFSRVVFGRAMKVAKGYDCDCTVSKRTSMTVRSGLAYDNQRIVQSKRASGELPAENAGLPWGKWVSFPHVIEHKGETFIRLYPVAGSKGTVEYFVNGAPATREAVEILCPSEFRSKSAPADCFTVKLANIVSLNGVLNSSLTC